MEGNAVKGVIFESKEGRKAVMAKVVIDATGDGDIREPISSMEGARTAPGTALRRVYHSS